MSENDVCPKCGCELELSDRQGMKEEYRGVMKSLLVGDHLPYCPQCGIEPFLVGKKVKVVFATDGFLPDWSMGKVGEIIRIGYDDFGSGEMDDPYLIVYFKDEKHEDGTPDRRDMFFVEEVEFDE